VHRALAQVYEAFADAPRPRNDAALSFLSPDGFRHFIPAYMGFTLRLGDDYLAGQAGKGSPGGGTR
jgi:hypothetical protein